ncbi:aldose 1-epimerase [Polaribacter pectinis]|uniref:Aldose 1-epimerase n=1 Tax=Polaribacter pectinis TaxID=2738844 RepID=A0A7G9L9G1_9FLAO|nr:aldose 1-epimerase [Polaribacter pectinis]QNM85260.1 aldose 1-epimerase [Polaribacter pectinis]
MFKIYAITEKGFNFFELKNTENNSVARISLEEGGRLQKLQFNNTILIEDQPNFKYEDSFASAILFPFASRIENGAYTFKGKNYQFECNEKGRNNALHGLVFNKKFKLLEKEITSNSCAITIYYSEKNASKGFPYKYSIYLTYTLLKDELQLKVSVKNDDIKAFPYTLGWHPYFINNDLHNSSLNFKCDKKVVFNENLITKKITDYKKEELLKIENKQLDDCFFLIDDKIQFTTPSYHFELSSNIKKNYLQIYTPKGIAAIAIEPLTGISNSFNNEIGLQTLEPNTSYSIKWNLKLCNKN